MFKETLKVKSSEVDELKKLKLSSFFKMFQDVAVDAIEDLGIGLSYNESRGLIWVITRARVEFYRTPKLNENITIYTYPDKTLRFIYPRYIFVKDENDNVIIKMATTWALLDDKTRKIAFIDPKDLNLKYESYPDQLELPKKLDIPLGDFIKEVEVTFTDCDINRHLNNTSYIDYILDLHDFDFYQKHEIISFKIDYMIEVKEKQHIKLYLKEENNISYITGIVNDNIVFQAQINFKDI